jgi:hypothetical protein
MGRNLALVEDDAALGVDAGGDVGGRDLARLRLQGGRVLPDRDRMQIDDAEHAVIAVLQPHPVADRAEIVAEMHVLGRLDAGEDSLHGPGWRRRWEARDLPVLRACYLP